MRRICLNGGAWRGSVGGRLGGVTMSGMRMPYPAAWIIVGDEAFDV